MAITIIFNIRLLTNGEHPIQTPITIETREYIKYLIKFNNFTIVLKTCQ